ncbi:MAG TPA: ribonuclease III family protein [Candidatus Deferrimicrobium sp.]|nr:ribonuclease III family protein [Candidatus Deferrimicrobium sp.]
MVIEKLCAIKNFSNLREIAINKDLAKLGDNFVNFIYSLAKSCVLGQFSGWKLPDKVLAQALRDADLRFLISTKSSAHDLGDAVESLIVYAWVFQKFSLEELTTILYNQLKTGDFSDKKKEERSAIQAFTAVLLEIKNSV